MDASYDFYFGLRHHCYYIIGGFYCHHTRYVLLNSPQHSWGFKHFNYIFVSDEPQKVDAIFLPGGSHPEQPEYAAELYCKGLAKWLVPSGGISVKSDKWHGVRSKAEIYDGDYHSDCEFFTDVLVKNGVPITAIIEENKSGHTRDNAFLSRKAVDENGVEIKTAIIVCKAFHARRCLMLYQMAFPNVDIKVCPVLSPFQIVTRNQ